MTQERRRVAFVIFDGGSLFELSGPLAVFTRHVDGRSPWDVGVCADTSEPLRATAGLRLHGHRSLRWAATADLIVIPTWPHPGDAPPRSVLDLVVHANRRGATVVGLCQGAFVLAAAGLLSGRRATTHWERLGELARFHPDVEVVEDQLYVDEGAVVTSAGSAAGLDCCLHLVRRFEGAEIARRLSRTLVVAPHREGDQRQFVEPLIARPGGVDGRERAALDRIAADPGTVRDVAEMARELAMSKRSLERKFAAAHGTTPKRWLTARRLDVARGLLESDGSSLDGVAAMAGFPSVEAMRTAFRRDLGVSPAAYRASFSRP